MKLRCEAKVVCFLLTSRAQVLPLGVTPNKNSPNVFQSRGTGKFKMECYPTVQGKMQIRVRMGRKLQVSVSEGSKLKTCVVSDNKTDIDGYMYTQVCICIENSVEGHMKTGDGFVSEEGDLRECLFFSFGATF
jgi:hypothetical protein